MDKKKSQNKLSRSSFINTMKEGLSFSDYFDDSVPYEQKPPEMLRPMQEDDYPIQAKDKFKGLWEFDSLLQTNHEQFWLDPQGEFHETSYHPRWAKEWLAANNIDWDKNVSVYTAMFKRGFIRVWKTTQNHMIHYQYGDRGDVVVPPNYKQMAALKNAAIELGYNLYDDLKNREIELQESLMLENALRDGYDYWMDSHNRFHRAPDGHVAWGRAYLLTQGIPYDAGDAETSVYDFMFELQFIRVKVRWKTIYFEHGPDNPPTNSQMRELKNTAIESQFRLIDATTRQKEIDLLQESFNSDESSYWLDPHGKFHDVGYEGHVPFAAHHLSQNKVPLDQDGYYGTMYKLGWVRVYTDEDTIYISHNPSREPNNTQWRALRDAAAEFNKEIYDDTTNRNIELQEEKGSRNLFIEHMMPEDTNTFKSHLTQLFAYLQKELQLKTVPKVKLISDDKNAAKVLGKTAYYEPETKTVVLYITNRHQKDILRSFAHEVIHHWQHENEKLQTFSKKEEGHGESPRATQDPQYAQNNPWLRQMEKQAYLLGNIIFRDWEDQKKAKDRKSQKKMVEKTMLIGKQYPPKKADYRG